MLKIKIKKEVEYEIKTPYFGNEYSSFIAIFDNSIITVHPSLIVVNDTLDPNTAERVVNGRFTEITESEFKTAFANANSVITLAYHNAFSKKNDFIDEQSDRAGEVKE